MREPGIGRVLVASLHQAIADLLPTRLAFYENWLSADGLREGTIGPAPLYAVLSFLRLEGDAYDIVTARAGEYAADWTIDSMAPLRRSLIRAAPGWLRGRLVMGITSDLVRNIYQGSRAFPRLRRGTGTMEVRASIFCTVREPVGHPLCGFYGAAMTRLMSRFDLEATTGVSACRGTGEPACVITVAVGRAGAAPERVEPV
jgi:hypothetical protein